MSKVERTIKERNIDYASANVQSNQYCMTFTVAQGSVPTCPGQVATTT